MIKQTKYWIRDLTENVQFISTCIGKKIPFCEEESDELLLEFEKRIMMSCYIIRKLNESKKIPDELYKSEVDLVFYPKSKKDSLNSEFTNIEEIHDMERREIKSKYFSYIVNQIIHSHYFETCQYFDETISGFFFNSDRSKKKGIYYLGIDEFFEVLTDVARVYADGEIAFTRNADGKFVKVWGE
jgi:hypothetical protein